jgi:hypothetical protein
MRKVLAVQGVYYLITGIWPLLSMRSFEAVTGPKTDDWLVQTVGVLAAAIGATLIYSILLKAPSREAVFLSIVSAAGFLAVDVIFVSLGRISAIYLVDAVVQIILLLGLLVSAWVQRPMFLDHVEVDVPKCKNGSL